MQLQGLATRTSTYFVDEVVDLGDVVAMRCPKEPTFIDGNILTYPTAPQAGDLPRWEARFDEVFADVAGLRQRAFFWDDPCGSEGAADEFIAAGYSLETSTVRVAQAHELRVPKNLVPELVVRPAVSDADWALIPSMQASDTEHAPNQASRIARLHARAAFLRQRAEGALPDLRGAWFLAVLEGEPVGTLGLFQRGALARFAFVHVLAHARRRGVGRTMVHAVARHGFERWQAERIVILADENSAADRMYGELGFRAVARDVGVIEEANRRR